MSATATEPRYILGGEEEAFVRAHEGHIGRLVIVALREGGSESMERRYRCETCDVNFHGHEMKGGTDGTGNAER